MRPRASAPAVPPDLRTRLEHARLDTLALLRALDRAVLPIPHLPHAALHHLYELDADCAEALWALDQPAGALDVKTMVRDTLRSLDHLLAARAAVRARVPTPPRVAALESSIRAELDPGEAYNDVPGYSPQNR
ncbi:MAG: hypothetical protein AB1806_09220 [Acidobacteriota bacterium]